MIQWFSSSSSDSNRKELARRGFDLGWIAEGSRPEMPDYEAIKTKWHNDETVMLPGILNDAMSNHTKNVRQSHQMMENTLNGKELSVQFGEEPYVSRLRPKFPLVSAVFEHHDEQCIEKIFFDAEENGNVIAEDLWCKASWLSFHNDDASMRFRFSLGMEGYEDVAADPERQLLAAEITDAIFPESAAITEHEKLNKLLAEMVGSNPAFTERIIYFNAPNGGAQMHHDVERGHLGVVFAQMSGSTGWLALAKPVLIDEIRAFLSLPESEAALSKVLPDIDARNALRELAQDRAALSSHMDEYDHEFSEALMDRCPEFIQHLFDQGYGYILNPGDVLMMPQRDLETCVWHTVFCLDDEPGEALSFALRTVD
ncbi:MAG: hypothetical protein R8K54_06060 [Mariprofundaceae bacterium]